MKKIVLKVLPAAIDELINERAKEEKISREQAVVRILDDVYVERAIQHDLELIETWNAEDDESEEPPSRCCRHVCCCGLAAAR